MDRLQASKPRKAVFSNKKFMEDISKPAFDFNKTKISEKLPQIRYHSTKSAVVISEENPYRSHVGIKTIDIGYFGSNKTLKDEH